MRPAFGTLSVDDKGAPLRMFIQASDLALAKKERPRIDLLGIEEALTASYECPDFDCVLRAAHRLDALVGEKVQLSYGIDRGGRVQWHVYRTPQPFEKNQAPCTLEGAAFKAQQPGLFCLRVQLGDSGLYRDIDIAVWPRECLSALEYAEDPAAARMRLRAITRDPLSTRESAAAALETPYTPVMHPVFGRLYPTSQFAVYVGRSVEAGINLKAYHG